MALPNNALYEKSIWYHMTVLPVSHQPSNEYIQARIQLLAKGEVVKIMENNVLLPQAATACHENEFRNQLVYEL